MMAHSDFDTNTHRFRIQTYKVLLQVTNHITAPTYRADLSFIAHDGKLWTYQGIDLSSFELMYGLYQVTKMIPALLQSTFELSLVDDQHNIEQALDIIDSWLFQLKTYQHLHATQLPHLLNEIQTGTTICSTLASPQDEIFSDISEKQHMPLSEVFALLINMIERYKLALVEADVPKYDALCDELIYTTIDIARMYAIYQHNVKNKLYSLFRENSVQPPRIQIRDTKS
jgi:hypothetical protein